MFTGLVQALGEVRSLERRVHTCVSGFEPTANDTVKVGDSIAVDGLFDRYSLECDTWYGIFPMRPCGDLGQKVGMRVHLRGR